MKHKIYLSPPYQSGKELEYIKEAIESNYIAPVGEFIDKFEGAICEYTGAKYAVGVSSGTSAIHLALRVLGIKAGDVVLASTFTFIGSVAPILYQNAEPVFIDSDYKSWNIDPNLLEDAIKNLIKIGKIPKVLILTHIYGQPADMDAIVSICDRYNIKLIEDAAEALGATYKEKYVGTFGEVGIYSFNGNKIITTSGGGVAVTNNKHLASKIKFYSTQAKENEIWYEHKEYGYNYRMSNILAAIGLAQIETINYRVKKRREIFNWYKELLADIDGLEFMPELQDAKGNRWLTTVIFKNQNPFKITQKMQVKNIEVRPLWKPMHMQPVFRNTIRYTNGTSEDLFSRGLCLPSGTDLEYEDVKFIAKELKECLE
ncbi:MAG: aminotransferase class I/II-fold pyridoxal phosphate-dependent enzyme [Hydrogenothermaceae bacterium]|nr:aminotransferase class I/II-fold pyridoxal phosphate-dependent enzyme [Hydrogenothermaceae bacterium]